MNIQDKVIILYSTGCPKCRVLESKLNAKSIQYIKNDNVDEMIAKGLTETPCLEVDGEMMTFAQAVSWVNNH